MSETLHIPILVEEILTFARSAMELHPAGLIVDGTLGEGGHTLAFRKSFPDASILGLDRDPEMIQRAARRLEAEGIVVRTAEYGGNLPKSGETVLMLCPFGDSFDILKSAQVQFALLDLGVSTYHFLGAERGFSYTDHKLDMRLSPDLERSAADILNKESQEELARIFHEYGEERYSRRIASRIIENRPIESARQLADLVKKTIPGSSRSRIHPATRVFQGLRIAVNGELDQLNQVLAFFPELLAPGGMLSFLTFHSLEDRPVKMRFRELGESPEQYNRREMQKEWKRKADPGFSFFDLTRNPVAPSENEVHANAASRSARLRVLQKKGESAEKDTI